LNSAPIWEYLKNLCSVIGDADKGGRLELRTSYLSQLPIPNAGPRDRKYLAALAAKCVAAKGKDCSAWEREIDQRVAHLFNKDDGSPSVTARATEKVKNVTCPPTTSSTIATGNG
jgi:hypothetical protein